jgi:cell shape-determining protein MreD
MVEWLITWWWIPTLIYLGLGFVIATELEIHEWWEFILVTVIWPALFVIAAVVILKDKYDARMKIYIEEKHKL